MTTHPQGSEAPSTGDTPFLEPVVFYDGDCGLCHASVSFALPRDRSGMVRFAPLFGPTFEQARAQMPEAGIDWSHPPDSILVVHRDRVWIRSRAVSELLQRLQRPWPLLGTLLRWVPRPIADLGYRAVARVRNALFTRPNDVCPLVPPELRARFLP